MTGSDSPRVFVPPPLIFTGLLALGLLLQIRSPTLGVISILGGLFALGGVILIAVALGLFRKSGTRPEPWQPSSALVSTGLYGRTRNPMYLGMAALSLGLAMLFASLPAVVLTGVAALIIDRSVIPREERYLERRFGQEYLDYRRRVRRWL